MKYLVFDWAYVDKFFDIKEFHQSPLKSIMKYSFNPVNSFFKIGKLISMKKNKIDVQNSPFGFGNSASY